MPSAKANASSSPGASWSARRSLSRLPLGSGFERDGAARREVRVKAAADTRRTFDVELRLVPRQRVLDDGEAEPGAPGLARAAAIDAVEALGEARNVLGGDADAAVLDAERGTVRPVVPGDGELAAGGRVAHGVRDQIAE